MTAISRSRAAGRVALSVSLPLQCLEAIHEAADSIEVSTATLVREALAHYITSGPIVFPQTAVEVVLAEAARAKTTCRRSPRQVLATVTD